MKVGSSMLAGAPQRPGAAKLEIQLRHLESVLMGFKQAQPLEGGRFGKDQEAAGGGARTPRKPASQLVKAGQAQALGSDDGHGRHRVS